MCIVWSVERSIDFCSHCRQTRAQTFRQEKAPHPSSPIPFSPKAHPTSLSTSLHHLTSTALPVWPNRVTIEASSRRRPFLELKRPVQPLPNPVSPHYQHKARARLCSKSSGAILSIDQQSTRNTRARQPSTRTTTS